MPPLAGSAVYPVEALDPHGRFCLLLLELLLLITRQALAVRSRSPAVMPLVVEDHDRHQVVEIAQYPAGERLGRLRALVHDLVAAIAVLVLRLRVEDVPV